jgi:subtilisin family serine protease
MRTPRRSRAAPLVGVAAAAAAVFLLGAAGSGGGTTAQRIGGESWRGLIGPPQADVALGQRVIVVLNAPSLGDRVEESGGIASTRDERRWTAGAFAAQKQLITNLAVQGVAIRPEYTFARVLNGFSAALGPAAIAVLERTPTVAGVYPVRAAFPAAVSHTVLASPAFAADSGRRAGVALPGADGAGVTIALIDTGVDRSQPYLHGRVAGGFDVVDGAGPADAGKNPDDPAQQETHGTELAGLLVGRGGPGGLAGVAPGATVVPIRAAGWQRDASGGYAQYARSDQLLRALELAVDPNEDGDAHDAARVALVGLGERFAAFADSPEARAVDGALALDTLVVAPAGNDGTAGPGFGSVAGPGGAPGALTVGAADTRATLEDVRVVLRRGLDVLLDRRVPLLNAVPPSRPLSLAPGERRAAGGGMTDFFDRSGFSLVAGRAAIVRADERAADEAARAAGAGAGAVLLYGGELPPGALGLHDGVGIPVVDVPAAPALAALSASRLGADVQVSLGRTTSRPNPDAGRVAAFSSRGLAFDGRVKPDLVAPGVGIATADAGSGEDGRARYATVNGSSAAAAVVAGAAALIAQARPRLDARALKSAIGGYAQPVDERLTSAGTGMLDVGAAAAAEVAADPSSLAFGARRGAKWRSTRTITVSNVSSRRLVLAVRVRRHGGDAGALDLRAAPQRLVLRQGASAAVTVTARVSGRPPTDVGAGTIELYGDGGKPLRIPYAVVYRPYRGQLLADAALSRARFTPAARAPARLAVSAGAVLLRGGVVEVQPVARLDVQLFDGDGRALGLLARVRDLLPGRYTFGLTGRDPDGNELEPGPYRVRLVAWPATGGKPSIRSVTFTVE